ncbi:autotransporter outer membrane beta-barrel domain-containing protein [Achromobacter xylosoxidans]
MPQYLMRRSATSTGAIKPCAATGLPMRRLALSAAIATALAPHAATAQSAPAISPSPQAWTLAAPASNMQSIRPAGDYLAGGVLGGERIDLVDKTIQTRSNSEYGIHATAASAAFATNVNVQTSGSYAAGVLAKGTAATAALMGGSYSTSGLAADGIKAVEGGVITLDVDPRTGMGTTITTSGTSARGLLAERGGTIRANGVTIRTEADRSGTLASTGAMAGTNGEVSLNNSVIETLGSEAAGLYGEGVSTIRMTNGTITTHGFSSTGVGGFLGATGEVENVRITTTGTKARGVVSRSVGTVITVGNSDIQTQGEGAFGIHATEGGVLTIADSTIGTQGNDAYGVAAISGGSVSMANSSVTTLGDMGAAALYARDGGTVSVSGSVIQARGAEGQAIRSWADANRVNQIQVSDSQLFANGSAIVVKGDGQNSISLNGSEISSQSGVLFSNEAGAGASALSADASRLTGDIRVSDGYMADFGMYNGSRWTGAGTGLNQLSLENSQWLMTGSSQVATLRNSGTVSFAPGDFKTLTVSGDLSGGGLFEMNTDLGALQGDMLVVGGTATGDHRILVRDAGTEPSAAGQHLEIVRTEGGDARFSLANRGQVVEAGTYRYALQTSDTVGGRASDWSLVNTGKLSGAANAAVNTGGIGTMQGIWYAEMSTLVKRLGELRLGQDEGGPWARGFGQRQLIDNGGGRAFSQNIGGMEFGADTRKLVDGGRWYLGGMAGYSRADRDFDDEGKGNTDSYHVGAYATYIADSGWYVDAVAKVNHMRNDFKIQGTDGAAVDGDYRSNGVGMSLEAGRQIALNNGWFVEPQVQATVFHAGGGSYTASNGLRVDAESGNSVQLRAGSLFGKRIALGNGNEIQPYVKAAWIQELDGKSDVHTNGIATRTDLGGGRALVGAGVIGTVGQRHRLYADYEYQNGSGFESPWAVNVGYRYTW